MSLNPLNEIRYRHGLAMDHLKRAEISFSAGDWVGTVSASQLAIENFAKAVIATMEVPTWGHDPSNQLRNLVGRLPGILQGEIRELSSLAQEMAPEHGRSAYGEPTSGLLPGDIYKEHHASTALMKAKDARLKAEHALATLGVKL
jgi:HEPN domain-containing protein